jgi:hypothetical protein
MTNATGAKPQTRIALWAAAAVGAVAIASAAIAAAVGSGPTTLSEDEVTRQLAQAGLGTSSSQSSSPSSPSSSVDPGPSPAGSGAVTAGNGDMLSTRPGTVVATCSAGKVTLVSWSPNPGYRADDVVRGPAAKASVWFESDSHDDVLVEVSCVDGRPVATETAEKDDHGGLGDDSDDNSGHGSPGHSGSGHSGSGSGGDHPEDD